MPVATAHATIIRMQPAFPRYYRDRSHGIVAGVAAGLANYLGVKVVTVRWVLALLSFVNGIGILFYVAVWLFIPTRPESEDNAGTTHNGHNADTTIYTDQSSSATLTNWLLVFAAFAGAVLTGRIANSFLGISTPLLLSLTICAIGIVLSWIAYDRFNSKYSIVIIAVGTVFVFTGIVLATVEWGGDSGFGVALLAVALTLLGVSALAVPFGLQMWRRYTEESRQRAAADERAEIAARIHDSVLQTLALIQKRSTEAEVQKLARFQERELRQWLFAPRDNVSFFAAIERACGEVEDMFGVTVHPVTVGEDRIIDHNTHAAVFAAREAMVNAAKHAGVPSIDVYAECFDNVEIYVRDRGPGFDLDAIAEDRHGVRDSIIARVQRCGGEAQITSNNGTEVVIRMPFDGQ
ncbi:ATP-binding protein [Corynebacterium diphtheriae]|uniref:ATP-binding protein n=1 Tax=Corynebacterium diphtheriae TaxID=1717 RepID=UPI0009BEAA11|nr:ATP-binding protein [Corynebacterium diphtheriae]CAB0633826.1 ATP-binding protein [Corynebacterium diphtheriae]CAB0789066.1 ATP-binding protein [Corynebacterium diphtheriae]CAB0789848.1 ATP-binding protein [Corynebacterium diphtheriae]CAB0833464.1 ATP-binding protein [Corynebacterium diphtheriae]CAB0835306.1 ATP-binding protein [Corynebacterium diphtheriae]